MLNKLLFNNLVISNKKKIQQARTQTIQKLVQKIRKFKKLLEKQADNEKCKQRLRKTTEIMEYVKRLKSVEIMKMVLVLDKNPSAVLTNGLSTPDEIAIAMLTMNKIIHDLIKLFKEGLKLTASSGAGDASWKEELMQISKRRSKINRTEEKRLKRKELKEQKEMGRKRLEWLSDNKIDNNANINEQLSSSGIWKEDTMVDDTNEVKHEIDPVEKVNVVKEQKKFIKEKPIKSNKPTKIVNKPIKSAGNEVRQEHANNLGKPAPTATTFLEKPVNNKEHNDDIVSKPVTHTVDSFFITETGENYLSTAVVVHSNETEEQEDLSNGFNWNTSKRPHDNETNFKGNKRQFKDKTKDHRNMKQDSNIRAKATAPHVYNKTTNNNMHPSWLAKQKMKPVITAFQGKKITFGDEDGVPNNSTAHANENTAPLKMKSNVIKNETGNLHPSWLAKQKLKPTIAAFQGKKITFDNDDV